MKKWYDDSVASQKTVAYNTFLSKTLLQSPKMEGYFMPAGWCGDEMEVQHDRLKQFNFVMTPDQIDDMKAFLTQDSPDEQNVVFAIGEIDPAPRRLSLTFLVRFDIMQRDAVRVIVAMQSEKVVVARLFHWGWPSLFLRQLFCELHSLVVGS